MPLSGLAIAEVGIGGLLVYSGIKGYTIADTFTYLIKGTAPSDTEQINQETFGNPATVGATTPVSSQSASTSGLGSGTQQENEMEIAEFLVSNGYSDAAAAGIVSCIMGESSENPESEGTGGAGLIGWTPPSSAAPDQPIVTGNASKDMQTQLTDLLYYNEQQGSNLISMLNQISDPVQAADFYSQNFERPAVTDSDVRAGVAESVYSELQSKSGTGVTY